ETIAKAARNNGLRVKAYSLEAANVKHIRLPAIVHWNFNHFVVLEHWSSKRADIIDPTFGRRRLRQTEFNEGFTGVVLTFEPGAHFERRRSASASLWRQSLNSLLSFSGIPRVLVQILGASVVLQVLGLALPVFTKILVDELVPFTLTNLMPIVGISIVIIALA